MPVNLYWFSGTGNTLLIAEAMAGAFRAKGHAVSLIPIERTRPGEIDPAAVCGFAIPVAGQGTYPFIWEFLEALPQVKGTPCFLADTLALYSGGILGPVKRLLRRKGFRPLGAREFIMPDNLLRKAARPDYDTPLQRKGPRRAADFAGRLTEGRAQWWDIPLYSDLMSLWYRKRGFVRTFLKILPLRIDPERCTACGICVSLCPEHSLSMKEAKSVPVNTDRCSLCHRCFAYCPEGAINIGNKAHYPYKAVDLPHLLSALRQNPPA